MRHFFGNRTRYHLFFSVVLASLIATVGFAQKKDSGFIENKGQWDGGAQFLAQQKNLNFWVTSEGMVLDFRQPAQIAKEKNGLFKGARSPKQVRGHVIGLSFVNARPATSTGQKPMAGKFNYFIGNDQNRWAIDVPHFTEVRSETPYDGISVCYMLEDSKPRYDFIIKPGADAAQIGLRVDGAQGVGVLPNGHLLIETSLGGIEEAGLEAFQEVGGSKIGVPCKITTDAGVIRFDLSGYDPTHTLIIDPLIYCTYFGDLQFDEPTSLGVTKENNPVITGTTNSNEFPTTVGAYQTKETGSGSFVTKLDSDGHSLVWSTFLGDSGACDVEAQAIDASGNVVLTGYTSADDFPITKGVFQPKYKSFYANSAFVTKLSAGGNSLVYSTYLGGSGSDAAMFVALDDSGDPVVTGLSGSTDFPTTPGAFQRINRCWQAGNIFVAKLNSNASELLLGTYLGGSDADYPTGVAVDGVGDIAVAGWTIATDFPTTEGAYQASGARQSTNSFLSVFKTSGAIKYSTYFTYCSQLPTVAMDSAGEAIIAGVTENTFPTTPGAYQSKFIGPEGGDTGFIAKFVPDGSKLAWGTFFGGPEGAGIASLVLDADDNPVVFGVVSDVHFPTTPGSYQGIASNGSFFVSKLNSTGSKLLYSTEIGGFSYLGTISTAQLHPLQIALGSSERAVFIGTEFGEVFPVSSNAYQTELEEGASQHFIGSLSLIADAPSLGSLLLYPNTVFGSLPTDLYLCMANAGVNASNISLSVSGHAGITGSLTIPAQKVAVKIPVQTQYVSALTPVTITATLNGKSVSAVLMLEPGWLTFEKDSVIGGRAIYAALYGGSNQTYTLVSNNPSVIPPKSVTIPAGANVVSFQIETLAVTQDKTVTITATSKNFSKGFDVFLYPTP